MPPTLAELLATLVEGDSEATEDFTAPAEKKKPKASAKAAKSRKPEK